MRRIAVVTCIVGAFLSFCGMAVATDYGDIYLGGNETFTLRDGDTADIYMGEWATAYINGGVMSGGLAMEDSSTAYITAGNVASAAMVHDTKLYISGGSISVIEPAYFDSGELHLGGGDIGEVRGAYMLPNAAIYVHVSNPAFCWFDGSYLTGYWYGGDSMSIPMNQATYGHVTFLVEAVPVPEPGTLLLLSAGVFLGARTRKKKV